MKPACQHSVLPTMNVAKKIIFPFLFWTLLQDPLYAQKGFVTEAVFPEFSYLQNMRDIALDANGTEAYFTVQSPLGERSVLVRCQKNGSRWSAPEIAPFSGSFDDMEPFLDPSGLRLYFASNRPLDPSSVKTKDFDIWYVARKSVQADWGKPINLGAPVNTEHDEFYPSVSTNQNVYFTCAGRGGKGKDDIFMAQWEGDRYLEPAPLDDHINSDGYEFNAYVAPDESFLLYSAYQREDGLGSGDIYIALKTKEGAWAKALPLGPNFNSEKMDYCPFMDINNKTLYFTSKRSAISKDIKYGNLKAVLTDIEQYENGNSRIYKVSFDPRTLRTAH
ncbi:MAG: hypothetical protein V7724_05325 [Sediminicola sp.]